MFVVRTSMHYSLIHGGGVFLEQPVQQAQVLWPYDPRLDLAILADEIEDYPLVVQDYFRVDTFTAGVGGQLVRILCADNARHVIHENTPNLIDTPDGLQEIAARDIAEGEELTCNYFTSDLEAAAKLGREDA